MFFLRFLKNFDSLLAVHDQLTQAKMPPWAAIDGTGAMVVFAMVE